MNLLTVILPGGKSRGKLRQLGLSSKVGKKINETHRTGHGPARCMWMFQILSEWC